MSMPRHYEHDMPHTITIERQVRGGLRIPELFKRDAAVTRVVVRGYKLQNTKQKKATTK